MSASSAAELVRRFAEQALRFGSQVGYPRAVLRRLIAAATSGQVAISRLSALRSDGGGEVGVDLVLSSPIPRSTWQAVVFHYNGTVLAELERGSDAGVCYAVVLLSKESYFAGRTHLPLADRSDEELSWELGSLDSALAMAVVAAEIQPSPLELARLTSLREELLARTAET